MSVEQWLNIISSEGFWSGVLASLLAAIILGIVIFLLRNTIQAARDRQARGRREDELFENSLNLTNPYAPFAFGIVQARALRLFVVAVFVAYVGDIFGLFWPFNIVIYCISLFYIWSSLRWFYKIERRALDILTNPQSDKT